MEPTTGLEPEAPVDCGSLVIATITLLLSGGLVALRTAAVATGFPIAVMLILMCYGVWQALSAARPT